MPTVDAAWPNVRLTSLASAMPSCFHCASIRLIASTNFWPITVGSQCGRSNFKGSVTPAACRSFLASATLYSQFLALAPSAAGLRNCQYSPVKDNDWSASPSPALTAAVRALRFIDMLRACRRRLSLNGGLSLRMYSVLLPAAGYLNMWASGRAFRTRSRDSGANQYVTCVCFDEKSA